MVLTVLLIAQRLVLVLLKFAVRFSMAVLPPSTLLLILNLTVVLSPSPILFPTEGMDFSLLLDSSSASWMNGYTFVTGNDVPTRDPKIWNVYGSTDDGATWHFLDHQERDAAFPGRYTFYGYELPNQGLVFNKLKVEICMLVGPLRLFPSERPRC